MASRAARWIWEKSRAANGSLIVLLAIADECGKDGFAEMSVAQLSRKTRLSDRAVRGSLKDLERLGELSVTPHQGGISRYALTMTPADSAGPPRQNLPGGRICTPAESAGVKPDNPQASASTPADSAGPEIPDALKSSTTGSSPADVREASGKPAKPPVPPRPDVDRLCEHLADRIEANGSKRPNITKRWKDAARLLMDNDGRTEEQVHTAIDWCQQHHFWLRNIRSMEKLREQYDRLRLDAQAERERKARPAPNGHQPTHEEFEALRQNWARPLDAQEAGSDPRGNGRPDRVHSHLLPPAEDWQGNGSRLVRSDRAPGL